MFKLFLTIVFFALVITGCNLNTNLNDSSIQVKPGNVNQNANQPEVNANVNQAPTTQVNPSFSFDLTGDGMITKILNKKDNSIWISAPKDLCGAEMMIFSPKEPSQPQDSAKVILTQFNPGSDQPVKSLYLLDLPNKTCVKLAVSKELSDFGARVLSPDGTKLAVALETNEAKVLKVLDLIADQSRNLVTLGAGETLNGGYGALSNKFDIKWLDSNKIQYTVYEDTVKNYPAKTPDGPEKVKAVRTVNLQ